MPIREYKCPDCGLLSEKVYLGTDYPKTAECPRCHATAEARNFPSSIALARSGMDNAPLDNLIGKDAESRWSGLSERQAQRDTIRVAEQVQGLTAVGAGYKGISPDKKSLRTEVTRAVETQGFRSTE